jgi:octaprenyl-diphosphate synthase
MRIEQVTGVVREELKKVEKDLLSQLSSEVDIVTQVGQYVLSSGGKRFRPLILLLVSKHCSYKGAKHIALACALEYIHTATLLHDDVIDHAQIRRGSSSANSVWGNAISVVAGDFLLSKAFALLVDLDSPQILKLVAETTIRMAEGESHQQVSGGNPGLAEEEYIDIVKEKTASLISAASEAGALLGSRSARKQKAFRDYGLNLGIAFQITDDTLDYAFQGNRFGKTRAKDLQERKVTLPLIYALQQSTPRDRRRIMGAFTAARMKEKDVEAVADLVHKYCGLDYALRAARRYASAAKESLRALAPTPEKEALLGVADYVVRRKW